MIIAAHSFGGYISTKYALEYPERVKKLIMLSPFGVESTTDEDKINYHENLKTKSYMENQKLYGEPTILHYKILM